MAEPRRLIDALDDDFEREVLRSARSDAPNEAAFRRTLVSLGVGVAVMPVAAAGAAPSAGALGAKLGAAVLTKWLLAGVTLGAVAAGGVGLTQRALERRSEQPAAMAPLGAATPVAPAAPSPKKPPNAPRTEAGEPVAPEPNVPSQERDPTTPRASVTHLDTKNASSSSSKVDAPPENAPLEPSRSGPASRSFEVETHETAVQKLERETKLLDLARGELGRGSAVNALKTLDEYERAFPTGALSPEARVLKVRALIAVGRRGEAEALAARVIAAAPRSEHADAVRALLAGRANP
jgi:hypothetical protein